MIIVVIQFIILIKIVSPLKLSKFSLAVGLFVECIGPAVVISIILTLAGLIAWNRIPVSQFPDIVPPQVRVTTRFPGASAAVVESTVAQPLEAAINGVDRMLFMKSNSSNDGSYTLTVTFDLGTNPDINTVNVNSQRYADVC